MKCRWSSISRVPLFLLCFGIGILLLTGCKKRLVDELRSESDENVPPQRIVGALSADAVSYRTALVSDVMARAERIQESNILVPFDMQEAQYAQRIVDVLSTQKRTAGRRKMPFVISLASGNAVQESSQFTIHAITQFIGQTNNELRIAGGAFMEPMIAGNGVRIRVEGEDLVIIRENDDNMVVIYNSLDEPIQVSLPNQEGAVYINGGDVSMWHLHPNPLFKNIALSTEEHALEDMRVEYTFEYAERGLEAKLPRVVTKQIPLSKESLYSLGRENAYFLEELKGRFGILEERYERFLPPSQEVDISFSSFASTTQTLAEGVLLHRTGKENGGMKNKEDAEQTVGISVLKQKYGISSEALALMDVQQDVGVVSLPSVTADAQKIVFKTPSVEGSYVIYLKDTQGFEYILPFEVRADSGIQVGRFTDELRALGESRFPLEKEAVEDELTRVFGSGGRTATRYDYDRVIDITYHLIPLERLTNTFTLTTIFGNTLSMELDLYIESMPEQFKRKSIHGSPINLLPREGYWGERFEVATENLPASDMYFAPCRLGTPNFDQEQGYLLEKYLFICDESAVQRVHLDVPDKFTRRKEHQSTVEIPDEIGSAHYFKASFYEDFSESTHFIKSNIGLYAKVANEKTLHLRAVTLDKGDLLKSATVVVRDGYKQTELDTIALRNGYAEIEIGTYSSSEFITVSVVTPDDETFFALTPKGENWLYYTNEAQQIYKSVEMAGTIYTNELIQQQGSNWWRGGADSTKIYGYSDRALYRAGDTISYAGFVRDVSKIGNEKGYIPSGLVHVSLTDVQGNQIAYEDIVELDPYGGFSGVFTTQTSASLGTRYINYEFVGEASVSYSHDLRLEEFQKPTFFVDGQAQKTNGTIEIAMQPQYYFGSEVAMYDVFLDRTLESDSTCRRCRWRNEEEYYFNHTFGQSFTTGGSLSVKGQEGGSIAIPLLSEEGLPYRGSSLTLKATIKVRDHASDEVQFETIYLDIEPEVEIGLSGQPSERIYGSENTDYTIQGTYKGKNVEKFTYAWYYQSYEHDYQYGVDGNRYYVDGREFTPIASGHVDGKSFTVPTTAITEPGEYFLRVYAEDENGAILGEVQKSVSRYNRSRDDVSMGSLKNNYQLSVSIPKKTRSVGDDLQIDIDPYVKGATVIITVERGNQILDTYTKTLGSDKIEIPVKATYYPNVTVTVMEMVGEETALSEKRQEPRFYAGAAMADIDEDIVAMNIALETDNVSYEPGEEVTLTITTTDPDGRPIDARVSVSVVDQALADLYHIIKEPIPAFYVKMATSVPTFTTLKLLYQALKVFVTEGSKGGGGGPGLARFGDIRKVFKDMAFREAAVYTKNGKAKVTFTLPDNLTTRMIDTIAITKTGRLGTATSTFTVTKPLLLEANLPLFLTIGDVLEVPVKVIASKEVRIPAEGIEVVGTLKFEDGRSVALGTQFVKNNEKSVMSVSLPSQYVNTQNVILELGAKAGIHTDAVIQEIPVRSEGFTAHEFRGAKSAKTGSVISFDGEAQQAFREVSLSRFPVQAFVEAFTYLLHYPYGCTEQLISSLYPIIIAQQLTEEGLLGDKYIRGEMINLGGYNGRSPIAETVSAGFDKVWRHQNTDGGLGYRTEGESEYTLSSYAYSVMKIAQANGFSIHKERLTRLDEYLKTSEAGSLHDALYVQWQRVQFDDDSVDMPLIENNASIQDLVLAFAIAVEKRDGEYANRYFNAIQNKTLALNDEGRYHPFLTTVTMRSVYLKALLGYEALQNISTEISVAQRINEQVERLLEQRDNEGKRGRSTQDNMQALLALAYYISTQSSPDKDIACSVTINNETKNIVLSDSVFRHIFSGNAESISSLPVSWSCDDDVIGDVQVKYMVKNVASLKDQRVHVGKLNLQLPENGSAEIGDTLFLTGAFAVDQDAHQVAVEFFIPSTIKLLETIRSKNTSEQENNGYGYQNAELPFRITGGNRYCYPSHREVRFDRLFLYYEKLPAGTACEVSFKGLKAYEGKANVMPTRLREMYSTDVRARTIVQ